MATNAMVDEACSLQDAFKRIREARRILKKYGQLLPHDEQSRLQQRVEANENVLCSAMNTFTDSAADTAGQTLIGPACMCCVWTEQHEQSSRVPSSARDAVYAVHGCCCAHRPCHTCALPHVLCRGAQIQ